MNEQRTTTATVKCPYCGVNNAVAAPLERIPKWQVYLCDIEVGGCDKYFAIRTQAVIQAEAFPIVMEDEQA